MDAEKVKVVIVGAGPAGLATSACLNKHSIPNIILEKEDCYASLWKKRAYDRLKLHLGKQFCELPHMSYPLEAPTFIPKNQFIEYLDTYVTTFSIQPRCSRLVTSASYDARLKKWRVVAKNTSTMSRDRTDTHEDYVSEFLVVATGENSAGQMPEIPGLESFGGECLHSNQYSNGMRFEEKEVLVIGAGNSGMEIAHDLNNCGVRTSIVVRSPVHVLTAELVLAGMVMLQNGVAMHVVDSVILILSEIACGDMSPYGIQTPTKGPFYLKDTTGRSPIIDVGTMKNIKDGEIKVFPRVRSIEENNIHFEHGETKHFDAMVFATGYKSTVRKWLKDGEELFNEDGMPRERFPYHWKGKTTNIYCTGFSQRGLSGITYDSQNIARDINAKIMERQ